MVVHLRGLMEELKSLDASGVPYKGRLFLSDRAHIVFDFHQEVSHQTKSHHLTVGFRYLIVLSVLWLSLGCKIDGLNEERLGGDKLGTTKKGIGPAYSSKINRNGISV